MNISANNYLQPARYKSPRHILDYLKYEIIKLPPWTD